MNFREYWHLYGLAMVPVSWLVFAFLIIPLLK